MTDIFFLEKWGYFISHAAKNANIHEYEPHSNCEDCDFLDLLHHTSFSNFNFFCTEMKKTGLSLALLPNNNICFSVSVQLNSSTCMQQGQQL